MKANLLITFISLVSMVVLTDCKPNDDPRATKAISDSNYTLDEALAGKDIPNDIKENLRLVDVYYYSFDDSLHKGQLVIHKDLVDDINSIFAMLKTDRFPVERVVPVVRYNWSDDESMKADNSSAFNYRFIANTNQLSNHATGRAVDINPFQNPQIIDGVASPTEAVYDPKVKGTISNHSGVVKLFKDRGWSWGGDWKTRSDYQHFEKLK